MQLQPNTIFANRYQLERLLGRGGFSEVWLAKDNWTHLRIAIKVYAPGQGMDTNGLQEFCGELANVFDLNHTNLLKPTHVDTWNEMPYLIMAYCPQGSLSSKIGQMSEEQIWKMIHDVASGLAYLHNRDVVHQDIKPDNILIDELGNYVITDFGISTRARSALRKSVIGGSVSGGTTAYMGPERFSKQPAPTKASDIWSFGAMVYEVLETNVPFGEVGGGMQKGGAEIPYITTNISNALKFTIYKMLSKETWDRPTAETLVTWSQNPQTIAIDYDLLTAPEEPNKGDEIEQPIGTSRHTQRFSDTPKNAESRSEQEAKKVSNQTTSRTLAKWLIAVIVLIICLSIGVGVYLYNEQKRIEIEYVSSQHANAIADFHKFLSDANIDHIDKLDQAYNELQIIKETEEHPYFSGVYQYEDKLIALRNKTEDLYKDADNRYQSAPSGSTAEERNKTKRRKLAEFKQKLK